MVTARSVFIINLCWVFGAPSNFTPEASPSSGIPAAFCPVFIPLFLGKAAFENNPSVSIEWNYVTWVELPYPQLQEWAVIGLNQTHIPSPQDGWLKGWAIKLVQEEWT